MRWIASLVAEAYRILVRGGVFLYPADKRRSYGHGRLRLVYEANPIAFVMEKAGGAASDGETRILDIVPTSLHERTPLVFGSAEKVACIARYAEIRDGAAGALAALFPPRPPAGLRTRAMSVKHPIISVTGSSGAGTTSVQQHLRADLSAREGRRGLHRGRRLPPLRPHADARGDGGGGEEGQRPFQPFRPEREPHRRARGGVPRIRRARHAAARGTTSTTTREAKRYGAMPGTFTEWEPMPEGSDLLFYEGLHGAVVIDRRRRRAARGPEDRRRAGDQPRMDPEAASRPRRRAAIPPRR